MILDLLVDESKVPIEDLSRTAKASWWWSWTCCRSHGH